MPFLNGCLIWKRVGFFHHLLVWTFCTKITVNSGMLILLMWQIYLKSTRSFLLHHQWKISVQTGLCSLKIFFRTCAPSYICSNSVFAVSAPENKKSPSESAKLLVSDYETLCDHHLKKVFELSGSVFVTLSNWWHGVSPPQS